MADIQLVLSALNRASAELQRVKTDLNQINIAASKANAATAKGAVGLGKFNSALAATGLQSTQLGGQLGILSSSATSLGVATAGAAVGIGALVAGIGASVKAAIDFEKSFARIEKTVDGTEQQFNDLAKANRQIAKDLGINVNAINQIGEIAGQLGINIQGVAQFERTIAELGITTNVAVEEIASAFGTLVSVLGVPVDEVDRLGSALTALGNNFNSTEQQILDFSTRFAGAAKVIGIGVADVAGISNAFASVGVEAERGGTAIQKILFEIQKAATGTGEEAAKALGLFAAVTGQTVDQFRSLLKSDPTEVFIRFVEGLNAAGEQAIPVLEALGLADARVAAASLSAAGANDLLRRSVDTSTKAALENTATQIEVAKQLDTTAAQFAIFKANINDAAISIGQFFNPAVRSILTTLNELLTSFRESKGLAQFRTNMALLGTGIERIADLIRPAIAALLALKERFEELPGPVQTAVKVLLAIFTPIGALIVTIKTLTADWEAGWNRMAAVVETVINPVLVVATALINVIGGIANAAAGLAGGWDAIGAAISGAFAIATQAATSLIGAIQPLISAFAAVQSALATITPALSVFARVVAVVVLAPLIAATAAVATLAAAIVTHWGTITRTVSGAVAPVVAATQAIVSAILSIAQASARLAAEIAGYWRAVVAAVQAAVVGVVNAVNAIVSAVGNVVAAMASVVGGWVNAWGVMASVIQSAADVITSVLGGILGAIESAGDFLDTFINKANDLAGPLKGVLGKVGVEIPDLPTLDLKAPELSIPRAGAISGGGVGDINAELEALTSTAKIAAPEIGAASINLNDLNAALGAFNGGGGGGGGGAGGGVPAAVNGLQELAAAIQASGMTTTEFVARMELAQEQQAAVAEASRIVSEEAARSAIDLTKLGIVLGQAGISGEAFVAQQELLGLAAAFRQSGLSIEQFIDHINGFTSELLDRAREIAKRTGKAVNVFNTGPAGTVSGNTRRTAAGSVTDEGLAELIRRGLVPRDVPTRRVDPEAEFGRRAQEARGQTNITNNFGPVNNYQQMSRRQYHDEEALSFR